MSNYGPNVKKLILLYVSREAIPTGGGLADGVKFLTDAEYRKQVLIKGELAALDAIKMVKDAPDNPYGNDDEAIAGEILKRVEERHAQQRRGK